MHSVAIGSGSNCTTNGGTGTLGQIPQNGGSCTAVSDPGNLPDIIQNLIGSSLDSLSISVDGGAATPVPAADISAALPKPGAATVNYSTTVSGLTPGAHKICVTAGGSDALGHSATVTECTTVQVVQLSATPATATNELGSDNTHTVTATIAGDPSVVAGRLVSFTVGGQNAGATGTCNPSDCKTDATGKVTFTYSVPKADSSLGTDTITVSSLLGTPAAASTVTVNKKWVDTTPPALTCPPSVNPSGKQIPPASNEDGFFLLSATDTVTATANIVIAVNGLTRPDGTPFRSGDTIKYTQAADGTVPVSKKMGGGNSAVVAHVTSGGDMVLTATDTSGNTTTITCLVPKPPK